MLSKIAEIRITLVFLMIFVISAALLSIPNVMANEKQPQNTWKIKIIKGASDPNPSQIFYPDELPINIGDTIQWVNEDISTHSIASGLPKFPDHAGFFFHPGKVKPNDQVSITFTNEEYDAFYYFCEVHPWMTGKLFKGDAPVAQPETTSPIVIQKNKISEGEPVTISGQVAEDFAKTEYQILVYDQKNELLELIYGYFREDASYSETFIPTNGNDDLPGDKTVKLVYGLPSKVATSKFELVNYKQSQPASKIPSWIKNNAQWWSDGLINDSEFVMAIQYLIDQKLLKVVPTTKDIGSEIEVIPAWIKNKAGQWSEDQISDADFLTGIEFLVHKGTIKI